MTQANSLRKLFESAPPSVTVVDVSARDGLQAVPVVLAPEVRARWIRQVLETGVPEVEAGSFVHPGRVPQMARTDRVVKALEPWRERIWVLVPNLRGVEEAVEAGCPNVVCLVSATETHSLANLGRPVARVLDELRAMAREIDRAGMRARVALSVAWLDPVEGPVPPERVLALCRELLDMGFREITLCDTVGGASPRAVAELVTAAASHVPLEGLGVHLHDPFGTAPAAVLAAWLAGVARFDAALGGLGGCPVLPRPEGNLDMETLVRLLEGAGATTGVDLEGLAEARRACLQALASPPEGNG